MSTWASLLLTASLPLLLSHAPATPKGAADASGRSSNPDRQGGQRERKPWEPLGSPPGDARLRRLGEEKARQLGRNPIFVMANEKGESVLVGGKYHIRDGFIVVIEGDMVINVGTRDYRRMGTTLRPGEYAIQEKEAFTKGECSLLDEPKHTEDSQTGSTREGTESEWNSLGWPAAGFGLLVAVGMAVWAWRVLSVRRQSRKRKPVVFPVK